MLFCGGLHLLNLLESSIPLFYDLGVRMYRQLGERYVYHSGMAATLCSYLAAVLTRKDSSLPPFLLLRSDPDTRLRVHFELSWLKPAGG